MNYEYERYIGLFKALSDANRIKVVDMLSCGELCACHLLEKLHITQPTLSHHMKILCDCRLVTGRKEGKWMHYSLNGESVQAIKDFLNYITTNKDDCICMRGFSMTKVGFICVHNSCRSQIAEALGKHLAGDAFESYSAGTETRPQINQDAIRLMKQIYGIDMEKTQFSKLLPDMPPLDVVITMGCNVECPLLPCKHREDWGLEDPTGKSDEEFIKIIKEIDKKVRDLAERIRAGEVGHENSAN